jgi:hypothetical protein
MGKNNKQRRAAKAKRRASKGRDGRAGPAASGRPADPGPSEAELVDALYELNQSARGRGHTSEVAATVGELARCSPSAVAEQLELEFGRLLSRMWDGGWLPGELIREVKRATSANGERLAARAVAADHAGRDPSTLHPDWRRHVEQLGLPSDISSRRWLLSPSLVESFTTRLDWPDVIELASSITFALCNLTRLDEVIPPPGAETASRSIADLSSQAADPILTKVRQLLAQAESTNFDAEAETFTAKAQELMARHAIDAAVVWDRQERTEEPITIRIAIDDPYVEAKNLLITVVAEASQCRAVIHTRYHLASLVGFESDLVWCETLYTSLLVQAQRELARAGATDRAGGRRRSRSFRSSFLTAYAHRIGERLDDVNAHVQDTAADVASLDNLDGDIGPTTTASPAASTLLPVLASRRAAVDDAVDARFGALTAGPSRRVGDAAGWNAGRQAADRAHLARGDLAPAERSG